MLRSFGRGLITRSVQARWGLAAQLVTGPEKLFFVCRVYVQDLDINSFEIPTIKNIGKTKQNGLLFELRAELVFRSIPYGFGSVKLRGIREWDPKSLCRL